MIVEILALGAIGYVLLKRKVTGEIEKVERSAKNRIDKFPINSAAFLNNVRGVQSRNLTQTGANSQDILLQDPLGLRKARITNVGQNTDQIFALMRDRMAQAEKNVAVFENRLLAGADLGQTTFINGNVTRYRLPYDFPPEVLGGNRIITRG